MEAVALEVRIAVLLAPSLTDTSLRWTEASEDAEVGQDITFVGLGGMGEEKQDGLPSAAVCV